MQTKNKRIKVTMPTDLQIIICQTQKPNQSFDERVEELITLGLKTSGNK